MCAISAKCRPRAVSLNSAESRATIFHASSLSPPELCNSIATSSKPFQYSLRCVPIYLFIYLYSLELGRNRPLFHHHAPLPFHYKNSLGGLSPIFVDYYPTVDTFFSSRPLLLLGLCRVLLISPLAITSLFLNCTLLLLSTVPTLVRA